MNATAKNGDVWSGEKQDGLWLYLDSSGHLYESTEVPAYRIKMDGAHQVLLNGRPVIAPNGKYPATK